MRVVVTGASGNIGSCVLDTLEADDRVGAVVGIARRPPGREVRSKITWAAADLSTDPLVHLLRGADVVIHLAWKIQPSWDHEVLERTNVVGSHRTFEAVAEAGVPAIVHASSVGAYAPGPKEPPVDESWPLGGYPGHPYSVHKAEVEGLLDRFEADHPDRRVVRLRPCLVFQTAAGREIRRYFLPRHLPGFVLNPSVLARNPARFQVVHATDVADAFVTAALGDASGPFNIATDDVIGGRALPFLDKVLRPLASVTWRLHLQPVDPGWVGLVFRSPTLDSTRARRELGWAPRHSGHAAFAEGLRAMADPPAPSTPALSGEESRATIEQTR
ncbi:MAG TPA: NAD-dependent epimerase/dehydratase family protein [Aquihabitans sp.]|nr:NAD-dependent epimerase/dehydratase family protein [Aquihabitans sp.]